MCGVFRSECASAEQTGVHPGHRRGGGGGRQQLQLLVPTGHLDSAAQVRQRAVRGHALQPGEALLLLLLLLLLAAVEHILDLALCANVFVRMSRFYQITVKAC